MQVIFVLSGFKVWLRLLLIVLGCTLLPPQHAWATTYCELGQYIKYTAGYNPIYPKLDGVYPYAQGTGHTPQDVSWTYSDTWLGMLTTRKRFVISTEMPQSTVLDRITRINNKNNPMTIFCYRTNAGPEEPIKLLFWNRSDSLGAHLRVELEINNKRFACPVNVDSCEIDVSSVLGNAPACNKVLSETTESGRITTISNTPDGLYGGDWIKYPPCGKDSWRKIDNVSLATLLVKKSVVGDITESSPQIAAGSAVWSLSGGLVGRITFGSGTSFFIAGCDTKVLMDPPVVKFGLLQESKFINNKLLVERSFNVKLFKSCNSVYAVDAAFLPLNNRTISSDGYMFYPYNVETPNVANIGVGIKIKNNTTNQLIKFGEPFPLLGNMGAFDGLIIKSFTAQLFATTPNPTAGVFRGAAALELYYK